MKQYFAKYLPVEGSVEHGDLYFFNEDECKRLNVSINSVGRANTNAFGQPKYHYHGRQKAKLFLCSKDIQVGDICYFNDDPLAAEVQATEKSLDFLKRKSFKKVGEISPNAEWVKEGDEFDEDQVAPTCNLARDDQFYLWSALEFCSKEKGFRIKVKCPCCGDFK
jgi:hypothetical protein